MAAEGSPATVDRLGRKASTALRDIAKQLGITVSLRIVPPDKFFTEMEGKIPFNINGLFGRSTPDFITYAWYHSTVSWNNTLWHYRNAEVDKLLDAARSTTDKTEQAKLDGRFQEIVAKDGPGCLVYVKNFACGVSKKVQGFTSSPLMWVDISNVTIST